MHRYHITLDQRTLLVVYVIDMDADAAPMRVSANVCNIFLHLRNLFIYLMICQSVNISFPGNAGCRARSAAETWTDAISIPNEHIHFKDGLTWIAIPGTGRVTSHTPCRRAGL